MIEFSVLPFKIFYKNDQDVLYLCNNSKIYICSSSVQFPFLTWGLRMLTHLSLHYFPHLPLINLEHSVHFFAPFSSIHFSRISSSSSLQFPFLEAQTKFQYFYMHFFGDIDGNDLEIKFQFSPCCFTSLNKSWTHYSSHFTKFFFILELWSTYYYISSSLEISLYLTIFLIN